MKNWLIFIDIQAQQLHLFHQRTWVCSYPISTAKNGTVQEEGSGNPWDYMRLERRLVMELSRMLSSYRERIQVS